MTMSMDHYRMNDYIARLSGQQNSKPTNTVQQQNSKPATTVQQPQAAQPAATVKPQQPVTPPQTQTTPSIPANARTVRDEFVSQHKKNGLFEKFYNKLKNVTHIGIGSKKVEATLKDYESGKVDKNTADEIVSDYRVSQENSAQVLGDVTSSLVGLGTFFGLKNLATRWNGAYELNAVPSEIKEFTGDIKNLLKNKPAVIAIATVAAAMNAAFTKSTVLNINGLGSKEFKKSEEEKAIEEQIKQKKKDKAPKAEIRQLRKQLKTLEQSRSDAKKKQNTHNLMTGALNGLLSPVAALGGGILGGPLYALAGLGTRYATSNNNDNEKSVDDFANTLKNNGVMTAIGAAAVALPALKKGKFSGTLSENVDEVVKLLKGKELRTSEFSTSKTAYEEIESEMLHSDKIQKIIHSDMSVDDQIRALTKENIFAVKFLQIQPEGSSKLVDALKENCPSTRTLKQAQAEIDRLMKGKTQYTVTKQLGVGTIAESYLAKDASGKEVCIKILKDGISADKIKKDEQAFIDLIKGGVPDEKLTEQQKYQIKNVKNLAQGILQEVDFKHEKEAAEKLAKYTKAANVVKPLEAHDGIYVMEKANGISLKSFAEYFSLQRERKYASGARLKEIDEKIAKIRAKSPNFDDFDLTDAEIKTVLKKYMEVMIEQFNKVDKNGKTLHADIHPGNIFIDLGALKSKKGKLFTLIDTGNTIDLSREQALRNMKLTAFIDKANSKDISEFALEGAVLPQGMTHEQAVATVKKELDKIFFDTETHPQKLNNDELIKLTSNIMRKYGIMPNDTQLNLNKAKKSAETSFENLSRTLWNKKFDKIGESQNASELISGISGMLKDGADVGISYKSGQKMQEMKNLFHMPIGEAIRQFRNPDMKKTNSVDYLIYKYKQDMPQEQHMFDLSGIQESLGGGLS